MICSTSSSCRALIASPLLMLLVLSSCASPTGQAAPPLEFGSLTPEVHGPVFARSTSIRWSATVSGGAGELTYEFRSRRGSAELVEQEGLSPTWNWSPRKTGTYRVKVTVEDSAGARVSSAWSPPIAVVPRPDMRGVIAVFPVDNLTGKRAPLREVGEMLRTTLEESGFQILDDETLEAFMKRYRIRDTGGLGTHVARAVEEETGAEAVLMTSLVIFHEADPPKVALFSRLVSSGDRPEIRWMDGAGLSGDSAPGLLALGLIRDPEVLLSRAVRRIVHSLERTFPQADATARADSGDEFEERETRGDFASVPAEVEGKRRYRPHSFFRSPTLKANTEYSVAVVPFLNLSERRNAGKILAFHFVNQMLQNELLTVVEPGLVREQLLKYRLVMEAGPSIANAEILSSARSLGVDLVLSGEVFEYQDAIGVPVVDFSVKIIERTSGRVVWSSRSHNTGDQSVFFFDAGRVYSAHRLASEMVKGTSEMFGL